MCISTIFCQQGVWPVLKDTYSKLHYYCCTFQNQSIWHKNENINCICLTLPHCVFSNVSSNFLPQKRRSHIGCIWLTFPHYVFSNVPSNYYLHQRMLNHTGGICLTCLPCAFLNVSSNSLPERMQNHIGYICLTFPTVRFHVFLQIACLRGYKVTLVTFVWLFSNVYFQMCP